MISTHTTHDHSIDANTYIKTYLKLIFLTFITVSCSTFVGGDAGLFVTIVISSLKGWLVLSVFMHLRYEDRTYSLVFMASLIFLAIFFLGTRAEWMSRGKVNKEQDTYELRKEKLIRGNRLQSAEEGVFPWNA